MWWLLFVVSFACGDFCLWCPLRAWRACVHGVALSLHGAPRIQSCTQHWKSELLFSGGVVQICFDFFSYPAFNLAPPAGNSHLFLTHYFICFVLLPRSLALLRRCFCVLSALLPRCFGVASVLLRRSFGVPSTSALLRRHALQLQCNFGATSAQPWLNNAFGSTKTSRPAAPMLLYVIFGLPVVCRNGSC